MVTMLSSNETIMDLNGSLKKRIMNMLNNEIKNFFQGVKMWSVYFIADVVFMYLTFNFI